MKLIFILGGLFLLKNQEARGDTSWSYTGNTGPENWKNLDNSYEKCGGMKQSPINIQPMQTEYNPNLGQFSMDGFSTSGNHTLFNNGHTVQVNVGTAATVTGGGLGNGLTFKVAQFHFHWGETVNTGSEHQVSGKSYPLELHIVTYNTKYNGLGEAADKDDGLAVLGFFFEVNELNNCHYDGLVNLLNEIPAKDNETTVQGTSLLPFIGFTSLKNFYRYKGSLTTPPCYESVTWTVFTDTIKLSASQFTQFRTLLYEDKYQNVRMLKNFRPPQPVNTRKVYTNFDNSVGAATSVFYHLGLLFSALLFTIYHMY